MARQRSAYSKAQRGIAVGVLSFFMIGLVPASYAEATRDANRAASLSEIPDVSLPEVAVPRFDEEVVLGIGTAKDRFWAHQLPDPVNARNANMFLPQVDLVIPGPGFDLRVARTYNSRSNEVGAFGWGWTSNFEVKVEPDAHGNLRVTDPDGFVSTFSKAGIKSDVVRARVAKDIVAGMKEENESRGQQHGDDFYERLFQRLRKDDAFFEDNRDRYATGQKAGDGVYWSADRGVQRIVQGNGGWIRVLPEGTQQHFDGSGRLTRTLDRNGNFLKLSYDDLGRLKTVSDRAGRSLSFTFNQAGRVTGVRDPIGRTLRYEYDVAGNLVASFDPTGARTSYAYDAEHNMTRVTWPDGSSVQTRYDIAKDWVLAQAGPGPKRTTYEYSGDPNEPSRYRTRITDSLGRVVTYDYDDASDTVSRTDPMGNRVETTYSRVLGKPIREVDALGNVTEYAYDAMGDLVAITNAAGQTTRLQYEPKFGRLAKKVGPDGTLTVQYDKRGNPVKVTGADGRSRTYTYDHAGNVAAVTEPDGAVTRLTWDDAGNPTSVTDPEGGVTKLVYDRVGRLQSLTDRVGVTTRYTFDAANRITRVVSEDGRSFSMTYDAAGRRTSITDARGATTRFRFDASGRQTEIVRADGTKISYAYDPMGQLRRVTDARGGTYAYSYDPAGRLVEAVDPAGATTKYDYDAAGRLTGITRANGARSEYAYDALGRLVSATDPLKGTALFSYDARGAITSITNQLGNIWRFEYDKAGRVTKVVDPTKKTRAFTYDAAGRRTSYTDDRGAVTSYAWDKSSRLLAVRDAQGDRRWTYDAGGRMTGYAESISGVNKVFAMTYDEANRMTSMRGPEGVVKRTFDAAGLLTSVTDPKGNRTTFRYDAMGRLVAMTDAKLDTTTFRHDAMGNVLEARDAKGYFVKHEYDAAGRRIATALPGGAFKFTYDATGNTTSIAGPDGRRTMTYDPAGRLASLTGPDGRTATYGYDAAGQLVSAPVERGRRAALSYDRAGRLTTFDGRSTSSPRVPSVSSSSYASSGLRGTSLGNTGRATTSASLPNASTAAPGATFTGPEWSAGVNRDGRSPTDSARVGGVPADSSGNTSAPGSGSTSNTGSTAGAGSGGGLADLLGGITVTPNPDGTFTVTLPLGDSGAGAFLTVGPDGITGGGVNYSFPMPGGTVGTIGVGYDVNNALTLGGGITLPGGLGSIDLSVAQNGTVMVGGSVAIPLGNGGSLVLNPAIVYGPDGLRWGGTTSIDIPGVGTFEVGFFDNQFRFADGTYSIDLPGGGLLEMNTTVVNGADGLEVFGTGNATLGGGLGAFDFTYGYVDGEPFFSSRGNVAVPVEGGGFIDVPVNFDFGPGGIAFSPDTVLSIPLGNGLFLNVNGTLENGLPNIGINDFCLTCFIFDTP